MVVAAVSKFCPDRWVDVEALGEEEYRALELTGEKMVRRVPVGNFYQGLV